MPDFTMKKRTVYLTQAKLENRIANGEIIPGAEYVIIDADLTPDFNFKGIFGAVAADYNAALLELVAAVPIGQEGWYAYLKPIGLPVKYAMWDTNTVPAEWYIGDDVPVITINNANNDVILELDNNELSANLIPNQYLPVPLLLDTHDLNSLPPQTSRLSHYKQDTAYAATPERNYPVLQAGLLVMFVVNDDTLYGSDRIQYYYTKSNVYYRVGTVNISEPVMIWSDWQALKIFNDAPKDGKTYGRRNGVWVEIV